MNIEIWLEDKEMEEYEKEMAEMEKMVARTYIKFTDKMAGIAGAKVAEARFYDNGNEWKIVKTVDGKERPVETKEKESRYFDKLKKALEHITEDGDDFIEEYIVLEF